MAQPDTNPTDSSGDYPPVAPGSVASTPAPPVPPQPAPPPPPPRATLPPVTPAPVAVPPVPAPPAPVDRVVPVQSPSTVENPSNGSTPLGGQVPAAQVPGGQIPGGQVQTRQRVVAPVPSGSKHQVNGVRPATGNSTTGNSANTQRVAPAATNGTPQRPNNRAVVQPNVPQQAQANPSRNVVSSGSGAVAAAPRVVVSDGQGTADPGASRSGRWSTLPGKPIPGQSSSTPKSAEQTAASLAGDVVDIEQVKRSVPAWLVSLIIHVVLLLLLALISTPVGQGIGKMVLEFGEAVEEESYELAEFNLESSDAMMEQTSDSDIDTPVEMDMQTIMDTMEAVEPVDEVPLDIGIGPMVTADMPMFSGRTGLMKQELLAMYGGSEETIEAVERGLRWLARNQDKRRGSWSMKGPYDDGSFMENRTAATAMAMLAFQGDGNSHLEGPYAEVVKKGLDYLLRVQGRDGFFAKDARGDERAYAQAQATIAICELYGMTRDSSLRPRAQVAIDYAIRAQSSEGGWRYQPRFDSDLSVTGWYVMALASARSAGLDVNEYALKAADDYLDTIQHFDGAGYGYQKGRPPSPAMTAEGLLCRQYLGWKRDRLAMEEGVNTLLEQAPLNTNNMNVYYWYYATQVMHHIGGNPWDEWNSVMKVELPKLQVKRGQESGSWSPQGDQWGRNSGRLYTTCLSLYCLEVYYRHLPLYKSTGK